MRISFSESGLCVVRVQESSDVSILDIDKAYIGVEETILLDSMQGLGWASIGFDAYKWLYCMETRPRK
ncbi:MAG: hypothetical protein VX278_15660 [Myxococcota bacterium]|nr:hypothetical protein [Myxococcota bacterium]